MSFTSKMSSVLAVPHSVRAACVAVIRPVLCCMPVLMLSAACSNAVDEYCRRPCYVVVDNSVHLDPTLASAMNPTTPGTFCTIQMTKKGEATFYHCHTNQGLDSDIRWTAIYDKMSVIVGLNNGIIVGYGNLDNPAVFYAYDRECPNCFDPDALPVRSKPLTTDERGIATCAVCHRTYNLNNRGIVASGDAGNPLTRFPAQTSGPFGVLTVR